MKTEHVSPGETADKSARVCFARFGWKRLALSRLVEVLLQPVIHILARPTAYAGTEPRTVLVTEFWNLGDVVMLTPFLKNLRVQYPSAHIAILTTPRAVPLLEAQGLVDEVIAVRVPWAQRGSRWRRYISPHWVEFFRCLRGLRARQFDWGFSGRADPRENMLLLLAGVRRRIGYGFGQGKSWLTDIVDPDLTKPHFSDRWLHLIEHVGKPVVYRQPEIKLTREEREAARQYLDSLGIRKSDLIIGVHAGAGNAVRQWGEQNFLAVAEKLAASYSLKVLWFQEPGSPNLPGCAGVTVVALLLHRFLAVVAECRLLLCNDSGPMHMATSVGVPVVSVMGPTSPAWVGPRNEQSRVVLHEGVWCRPCIDNCIFDQPYCLRTITVDQVLEASKEVLERVTGTETVGSERRLVMRAASCSSAKTNWHA